MGKYHRGHAFTLDKLCQVCYVIPVVNPAVCSGKGEGASVLYADGKCHGLRLSYRSTVKKMTQTLGLDYTYLTKNYSRYTGKCQGTPIPMSHNKYAVFVEVKIKNPEYRGQAAMGRINCQEIRSLTSIEGGARTEIVFKNGHVLISLYTYETVFHRILLAVRFNAIKQLELPETPVQEAIMDDPVCREITDWLIGMERPAKN